MAVATKHLTEEPPPLRSVAPDVDPGLEAVAAMAMAKEPQDRYPSADELREALIEAAGGQGPAAVGAESATTDPMGPHGTAVLPAAVPTAAAPTSTAPTPASPPPASPSHRRRRPAPPRRWQKVALALAAVLLLGTVVVAALAGSGDPLRRPRGGGGASEPVQTPTATSPEPTAPPDDPVFLAAGDLEEVVKDGIGTGDVDPEAGRKILEAIGKVKGSYASGDPGKALDHLDRLRDQVEEMYDKGDITSEGTTAEILQGIDAMGDAIVAVSPEDPGDEGDEGSAGDEGKGKGKGKGHGNGHGGDEGD